MKRGWYLLAATALAVGLCGCGQEAQPVADTTPTDWVAAMPEVTELSGLLTAAEVSEAVNMTVGDGALYENGTMLAFHSEDFTTQVSLLAEKPDEGAATYFTAITSDKAPEDLVLAPNLGDEAYWCAETGELMLRRGDYVMSLCVTRPGFSNENALIAARQLAALAMERLA